MSPRGNRSEAISRARTRGAVREKFAEYVGWVQDHPSDRWVFRGHARPWSLRPTVGRREAYRPEQEPLLLGEFKRGALPLIGPIRVERNWDWLSIAQHHGLPTRLLDWTTNPLVACFFATASEEADGATGEIVAVEPRQIGFYNSDDPSTPDPFDITETRFLRPPSLAARIHSQRGLFSVHPVPNEPWSLPERQKDVFRVPAEMKNDFRRTLSAMGFDDAFLMADLDGLARTLRWRFENRMLDE